MSIAPRRRDFFVAGGALSAKAPSYVERSADGELFGLTQAGEFSYVLTPRQMGKTSLMHRTAQRLKQEENVRTARIDLTLIGTASVAEWYLALLADLTRQLRLSVDLRAWWQTHAGLGPVTRFTNFVRDVLLSEIEADVVIFIDEIDFTLELKFSDDFFAAIRAFYNARPQEPSFERLTFVLLGVATPPDLIKERTRTPFNIGTGLILPDFSLAEAEVLQDGLEKACPSQGATIFGQIYQWTDGHPYLTQTLCKAVVKSKQARWSSEEIDELVQDSFLSEQGRKEDNLQFVQSRIVAHPQQRDLLGLYKKVYNRQKIQDNPQSILQNQLKLSGLVKTEEGCLQVRNNIYRQVFDLAWVKAHTAIDWTRIIAVSAVFFMLLFFGLLAQSTWAGIEADRLAGQIHQSREATKQVPLLADLFRLRAYASQTDYDYRAKEAFYGLPRERQLALFNGYHGPEENLIEVVKGFYTTFADVNEDDSTRPVLEAMRDALGRVEDSAKSAPLKAEISSWLEGRRLFQSSSYNEALAKYDEAIKSNDMNPATRYERARVRAKLGQDEAEAALADLDRVIGIAQNLPVPANATPAVTATATTPTSGSTQTLANTPSNEPPSPTTNGTGVVMPTAQAIATTPALPTATPTPVPAIITAQFDTREKMISAVRAFILQEPSLLQAFANAPDAQYANLQTTISLLLPIPVAQKDGMVQLYVPEGDFKMGSDDNNPDADDDEKPRHTVYLDAFWIDQTEVTNAMFANFLNEMGNQEEGAVTWLDEGGALIEQVNGAFQPKSGFANHPVIYVSWYGARGYCQRAGRRLPTEAEWEKAAGGVLTEEGAREWPWGNEAPTCEQAQISGCEGATVAVGTKPAGASPYGALDMAGNVWEWVEDTYEETYYASSPRENPAGPSTRSVKALRGGSWDLSAPYADVRNRNWSVAYDRGVGVGFRCARSP